MEKYLRLSIFVFLSITFLQCQSQQEKKMETEEDMKEEKNNEDLDFLPSKTSKNKSILAPPVDPTNGKKIYLVIVLLTKEGVKVNEQEVPKDSLYKTLVPHFHKIYPKKSKTNAVAVSYKVDRYASYKDYIEVLDIIKKVYKDFQNIEATKQFGKNYDNLSKDEKKQVKEVITLMISETEPSGIGD